MGVVVVKAKLLLLLTLVVEAITNYSAEINPANPECNGVTKDLHKCERIVVGGALVKSKIPKCCEGLQAIEKMEPTLGGRKTCQCLAIHRTIIMGDGAYADAVSPAADVPPDNVAAMFQEISSNCRPRMNLDVGYFNTADHVCPHE